MYTLMSVSGESLEESEARRSASEKGTSAQRAAWVKTRRAPGRADKLFRNIRILESRLREKIV